MPPAEDSAAPGEPRVTRATLIKVFAAIVIVSFLLRIFYSGHLYQDDGLWFTAAEEILRGKALYREVYFDKPPLLPLVYAGLFKLFGAHILTIRVFAILYSSAISALLYLFGLRLYGKRIGLLAAAMFAVFSTTYTTGHVQGFNTDFLMTLPYTAGAMLLIRSRQGVVRAAISADSSARLAFGGGVCVAVAFQANPKAVFDLIFFGVLLLVAVRWKNHDPSPACRSDSAENPMSAPHRTAAALSESSPRTSGSLLLLMALMGFMIGAAPFLIYIAATRSLSAYWVYVWDWGIRYAAYYPTGRVAWQALGQSAGYFALNNTLLIALLYVAAVTIRRAYKPAGGELSRRAFTSDVTLLIWFAVSYAGMSVGGRFFGHYFFQIMPSLCLIGARGLDGMTSSLLGLDRVRWKVFRGAVVGFLAVGFLFTLVRFHGRTFMLAVDWFGGSKSDVTAKWLHDRLNSEECLAAAAATGVGNDDPVLSRIPTETLRSAGPRTRAPDGPSDYLFVWGYRPEVYYWSGLLPASRFLSTQPLTGISADVHYFSEPRNLLEDSLAGAARAQLIAELEQTKPKYILDELGVFNYRLSIQTYPELREFMGSYRRMGKVGRFIVYRRWDTLRRHILRHQRRKAGGSRE